MEIKSKAFGLVLKNSNFLLDSIAVRDKFESAAVLYF